LLGSVIKPREISGDKEDLINALYDDCWNTYQPRGLMGTRLQRNKHSGTALRIRPNAEIKCRMLLASLATLDLE